MEFGRVLVAGGAGFLGRHLVRAFALKGADVTVLDSRVTASDPGPVDGAAREIRACVTRPEAWFDDLVSGGTAPELICNLACPASPLRYQRDPVHTLETSVAGSAALARLALAVNARFLQASTSEIYGDPEVHPQTESYAGHVPLDGPRSCYDEGKRAAEVLLRSMAETRSLDLRVARIFNTYGPGMAQSDGRAVVTFVAQALAGQPLTVFGDGSQTRSFCYVDDMIEGLVALAQSDHAGPGPVNLGNPEEVTLLELAERVRELTGDLSPITFEPLPRHDPVRRCPDIARARRLLDFAPGVSLGEGLKRTIAAARAATGGHS